jgi:hypothetical protein
MPSVTVRTRTTARTRLIRGARVASLPWTDGGGPVTLAVVSDGSLDIAGGVEQAGAAAAGAK